MAHYVGLHPGDHLDHGRTGRAWRACGGQRPARHRDGHHRAPAPQPDHLSARSKARIPYPAASGPAARPAVGGPAAAANAPARDYTRPAAARAGGPTARDVLPPASAPGPVPPSQPAQSRPAAARTARHHRSARTDRGRLHRACGSGYPGRGPGADRPGTRRVRTGGATL